MDALQKKLEEKKCTFYHENASDKWHILWQWQLFDGLAMKMYGGMMRVSSGKCKWWRFGLSANCKCVGNETCESKKYVPNSGLQIALLRCLFMPPHNW